jgi:hypothetical protein
VLNRKRRLIEIKEIQISQDQLEQINQFKTSRVIAWSGEYQRFLRNTGRAGVCCICNEPPSKMATYKVGTAFMVERYCGKCFSRIYDNLDEFNEKIVIIRGK